MPPHNYERSEREKRSVKKALVWFRKRGEKLFHASRQVRNGAYSKSLCGLKEPSQEDETKLCEMKPQCRKCDDLADQYYGGL